jgi:hypothetical protein
MLFFVGTYFRQVIIISKDYTTPMIISSKAHCLVLCHPAEHNNTYQLLLIKIRLFLMEINEGNQDQKYSGELGTSQK